jgi:serine/threonine-protein kinase RsbT
MHFRIGCSMDVERAWRCGLRTALDMGFSPPDASKVAVVISELGRNIERYAGKGSITLRAETGRRACIQIVAEDQGPGIPDLDLVLAGGHSTSNGMGLGVSGSRRLMDEFEIQSALGEGTTIRAMKWLH